MESKDLKNKIKNMLAEFLGVDTADINDDDDFSNDLQMEPTSISDFQEKLSAEGIDVNDIDFTEVSTIEELVDSIDGVSSTDSEE